MVVDDAPQNLRLLHKILSENNYKVVMFPTGVLALDAVRSNPPDLILLDINMPGIDGYEFCRRLKSDEQSKAIPVIFISALSDVEDKLRAFSLGGVDYITKPLQVEEVLVRIDTHLKIQSLNRSLSERNEALQSSINQLRESESQREKLTQFVVHDLRSPITALLGYCNLTLKAATKGSPEEQYTHKAVEAADTINDLVSSLLELTRFENGKVELHRESIDLGATLEGIVNDYASIESDKHVSFSPGEGNPIITGDISLVQRVAKNLIDNAIKFTPAGGCVDVAISQDAGCARVAITDEAAAIPEESRATIFEKFAQINGTAQSKGNSCGLGLAFCKYAVGAHNGRIGIEDGPTGGNRFWFELPAEN